MKLAFKNIAPFLTIFLVSVFCGGSFLLYKNETISLKERTNSKVEHSIHHFKEYFYISRSILYSMKFIIEDKYKKSYISIHPLYKNLDLKNKKTFRIKENKTFLIGDKQQKFSEELEKEINYSLYLEPVFSAALQVLPDIKKIYYKSANKFIFMSPFVNIENKEELSSLYECISWTDSIEKKDSYEQFIITKSYKDMLSKEKLLTVSLPIYDKNIFKGFVAIDIRLDTINSYLKSIPLDGDIYITNKENFSITSKNDMTLNKKLDFNEKLLIKEEIVNNQLYLTYPLDLNNIKEKAFFNSLGKILILMLLVIISIILVYLKLILDKVQHLANTDSLTKLLNRRAMQDAMDNQIKISRRYRQPLSFLLLDIDFFKKVNDTYGHHIGDLVLVEISKLLQNTIRDCDIVGRFGGEEFLITLANTDLDEAFITAERLREMINKIEIKKKRLNITVSIGCYSLKEEDSYESILKKVDKLLYKAKNTGRDKTVKED